MMNPYLSWAILLVVAGGLGWYYNGPTPKAAAPVKPVVEKPEAATGAKKPKRKPAKKEKSPEPTPVQKPEEKKQPAVEVKPQEAEKADEEIDNKEMAKRFAAVKSGTVPASGSSKSQKKKKNNKKAATTERSPSTTGADADDDLSSTGSPVVNPTSGGYVSDMLEEPAPAASVLRVTGSVESQPKKQKPQSFKPVETKKQRQQRQKNEARKEQVKEAEEERRKLLEKQLHSAREAERREAAKTKPAAPATNAWQTKNVNNVANGAPKPAAVPKVELLDTFDESSSAKSGSNQWSKDLPSEEEQMRLLSGADEWTTVSTKVKKPKKKGGKADESISEASASESNQPATTAPLPAEPKVTVTPTYIPDILRSKQKGHPLDSDWAA
ncbi:hypothetical protein SI65_07842 [Aspergillus cristatus]|uniref:Uncharacterized protein n=1 Tax=Aspergillus cristatus TaxID=573508 RepID=A0A1E3B7G9_ASPCR|nr:hypothetical protein SI65_07842 [Aspergillus cristatus]